jgi:hypothetical protein
MAMRKSKRVALKEQQAHLKELLEQYGIPMAGPDHPGYSTGPSIRIQPARLTIPNSEPEGEPEEDDEIEMSESAKEILRQLLSQ